MNEKSHFNLKSNLDYGILSFNRVQVLEMKLIELNL